MTINDLPAINASLNAVSTIFISAGWFWIRRNIWQRHVPCMIIALIASTGFLVGYIVYHLHAGEKSSGYTGLVAWIYFPILITHILLAFVTLPLVSAAQSCARPVVDVCSRTEAALQNKPW